MPSPDVRQYQDLTVYDRQPQDIFNAAKTALAVTLPNWIPLEGNTEVLLLEALSQEVAENTMAINRLPSGIAEILFRLFGLTRDSGLQPVVTLRFTMSNTLGYTIPAGTRARLTLPGGLLPVIFTTTTGLTIAPGNLTGDAAAVGSRFTVDANGSAGTSLELLDAIIFVENVVLQTITTPGRAPEIDSDFFARALLRFTRLSDAYVLPKHFQAAALEQTYVKRALAIDNWDGTGSTPGTVGGHITVAVYGNGANVSSGDKTTLGNLLEANSIGNLSVHIVDPTINTVAVTVTVKALAGYASGTVQTSITSALNTYLNPMNWDWSGTVRRNELIALISNVAGVDYVTTLAVPAADVVLTGNAPLASAGTLTITVT